MDWEGGMGCDRLDAVWHGMAWHGAGLVCMRRGVMWRDEIRWDGGMSMGWDGME